MVSVLRLQAVEGLADHDVGRVDGVALSDQSEKMKCRSVRGCQCCDTSSMSFSANLWPTPLFAPVTTAVGIFGLFWLHENSLIRGRTSS